MKQENNEARKQRSKEALACFVFLFFCFFVFPTPARAAVSCPDGGFVYDPTLPEEWQCCNYQNSSHHITADNPNCNSTHCQMQNFAKNPDSNTYGGVCRYCNPNVTVRIDGCSGCGCTCNQACAAGGPPGPPDEEGDCHMEDENLTTCCDLPTPSGFLNQLVDWVRQYVSDLSIPLPYSLTTTDDFKVSKKFEEETDYFYGSAHSELEPGVFFRLAPPNLLENYFPNEGDEAKKREEYAMWAIEIDRPSGGSGEGALNDGKTQNVEPYRLAVENLRNFLVATPKLEDGASSYYNRQPKEILASVPTTGSSTGDPKVLGSTNLCPDVKEYQTKKTCTPQDAKGADLTIGGFLDLIGGDLKLFPKIADLDKIGRYTTGVETDPEGKAHDSHYEDGGFLEIFRLPTEDPYEDIAGKGEAGLALQIGPITVNVPLIGPVTFGPIRFDTGKKDLKLRHEGAVTEALEGENKVWAKLTPPTVEDSTTTYQNPSAPVINLASNPTVQGTYSPQNTSFAERLGRTLGSWLAKLITL